MIVDTHGHYSAPPFDNNYPYISMDGDNFIVVPEGNREKIFEDMHKIGVKKYIEPAIDVDSNKKLLELCKRYKGFAFPAAGNHPTRCILSKFSDFKRVKEFANDENVIAIGETGLDYHYSRNIPDRKSQHRLKQKIWFQFQINLAHKHRLPLILHIRLANDDALRILRRNKNKLHGGVVHCFGSAPDVAKIYTEELGFCLGIGGTLLTSTTEGKQLADSVKEIPMEFLLLETDGPYVRPDVPDDISKKKWMKARNTSLILLAVAKRIAEIKGISTEEVIDITTKNAERVFGI